MLPNKDQPVKINSISYTVKIKIPLKIEVKNYKLSRNSLDQDYITLWEDVKTVTKAVTHVSKWRDSGYALEWCDRIL